MLPITAAERLPTLHQAARHIERARYLNVSYAARWLRSLSDTLNLLRLYQRFFPAEYAASRLRKIPRAGEGYSPAERRFFELVNQHLFPLALPALEDIYPDDRVERFDGIPLDVCGFDEYDDDSESWRPALRLIYHLWNQSDSDTDSWAALLAEVAPCAPLPRFVAEPEQHWRIDTHRLQALCRAFGKPLNGIMALIRRLQLATGTVWLDLTPEMFWSACQEVDWSEANIVWLAQQWKAAQAIDTAVANLWEWLEAEPTHMAAFVGLWNKALRSVTDREWHRWEMGSGQQEVGGESDDELEY
jgi:hypothetical protein